MWKKRVFAISAALLVNAAAHAQSAGNLVTNVGWFHFALQDSSQPLTVHALGSSLTATGSGASVDDSDTFGLTATYFVTDHIAAAAALGVPPKYRLTGTGTLSALGKVGSAYEWSPALILEYYFNNPTSNFRPYLGVGASYVWFSGVKLESAASNGAFLYSPTFGNALEGSTTAKLSSSFAPLVIGGLTYNFDRHWSVNAALGYMWLSTRATLTTQSSQGVVTSTTKIKLNPIVSFLSVGYRF
ncbi:OmpW/AlkL family protein [Burkholderia anthina]|uniref:OmpW/AlkL family protein n=1 Tax=Burkholderia anthina TaxID=179879 RepID=UPI00158DB350|nr:OmpW family outer membrane protein [Burkholderia anthina]